MKPAVFLDRDGTIIEDVGYLCSLDRVAFYPWTVDAIRVLNQAGLLVVVITNQAGVARGYFDEDFVRATHAFIDERVRSGGARIDAFYYCPHHPDGRVEPYRRACDCRKPRPGLIQQAARDLEIDLARSVLVGDKRLDVEAGRAAGLRAVLVRTGYGLGEEPGLAGGAEADLVADNLMAASSWILQTLRETARPGR